MTVVSKSQQKRLEAQKQPDLKDRVTVERRPEKVNPFPGMSDDDLFAAIRDSIGEGAWIRHGPHQPVEELIARYESLKMDARAQMQAMYEEI